MPHPDIDTHIMLSLEELARALKTPHTIIIEWVNHDVIIPIGNTPEEWQFDEINLKRAKTALSFQQDLQINLNGITLALDLLDQMNEMESELQALRKYFSN